jgi:chromosome segregation protein
LAVTADGDLADGRGLLVIRGRAERGVSEAARRHARRLELAEQLERLEAEQEQAAAEAGRAMADVSAAARRLEAARTRRESAEADERERAEAQAAIELRANRLASREAAIAADLAELPEVPEPAAVPPDGGGVSDVPALQARAESLRADRSVAAAERDAARDAWRAAQTAAREVEERVLGAQRSQALQEARRIQLEAAQGQHRDVIARVTEERAALQPELDAAAAADDSAVAARQAAEQERDAARAALVELERQSVGGGAALAELEREMQAAAIEASRHEDALAALARERQIALDTLADTEPDSADAPIEVDPALRAEVAALAPEALEQDLRRVRRTLSQIGSVNPFAVEEHRELSARLEELTSQDSDLGGAIGSTEELIARLDADIAERFNSAFAAIADRFDEFCQLLFAGGSASLSLGDGSDGEAPGGIEIVVRPPGKRLQRLAMLSGGERALTGVALLFAMLSVNPVPFCILDEVDAALDEANIGRFADALRRLAQDIDFVVITHNRATIEVADTIYGVTMSDAAVSAVVSLRLADLPQDLIDVAEAIEVAPA